MPHTSVIRRRASDSATRRARQGCANRITAVLARLERQILAEREFYLFGNCNQFRMEVAVSLEARRDASTLLPDSGDRQLHDFLPSATVLLVRAGDRPVGTVTLFVDGPMGLPLDDSCRGLLDPMRCGARRIAEIGMLGVAADLAPAATRCVVMHLVKVAWICARRLEETSDVVAGIDPGHVGLAARFLMVPMTEVWSGLLPVRLDAGESELAFLGRYAGLSGDRDLDLFMRREEGWLIDWLKERRRTLSEPVLLALLRDRRVSFAALDVEKRHALEDAYLAYDLNEVLS